MSCPKECLIFAGLGGVIPTIAKLASTYVSRPSTPMPESGLYFGLLLFFIIGSVLAYAFSETNMRQAFILGVCAPGIITNIVAGANEANSPNQVSQLFNFDFISSAYAQEKVTHSRAVFTHQKKLIRPPEKVIARKLIIKNDLLGASAWDIKNIPIHITAIQKNGNRKTIGSFPAYQQTTEVELPNNSSAVEIKAAKFSSRIQLPKNHFTSAVVSSQIRVSGKNDFFWALGAKRRPKVVSLSSRINHIKLAKPKRSIKEFLGKEVKKKDGTLIGKIEDIKFGETGEFASLQLIENNGSISTITMQQIKKVNNELVLAE